MFVLYTCVELIGFEIEMLQILDNHPKIALKINKVPIRYIEIKEYREKPDKARPDPNNWTNQNKYEIPTQDIGVNVVKRNVLS